MSTPYSQAAGNQLVLFDQGAEDPTGQWDGAGGGSVTIERAGMYLVTFGVGRASVAVTSSISGQIKVDGGNLASITIGSSTASLSLCGARSVFLSAGEVITLTATLHTTLSASFTASTTFLTVDRIGPVRWTG